MALVVASVMLLADGTAADGLPALSSARQFDQQIQRLVRTLSKSLVVVQVASRTSPFGSALESQPMAGSTQPIYLRNVSALAVDSGGYLICAAALLSNQDSLWLIRNGKRFAIRRIGIDYRSGLALLKTSAPNLLSVTYVHQPPSSGALALFLKAAGPESVEPTLAIASGTSSVDGYLEFSGPVGSGTVGGAFFNMDGHLLGLALGSLSGNGPSNRVFVLPVSRIEPIVTRLKCCGDREAGYLGVQVVNTMIRGLNLALNPTRFAADERRRESTAVKSVVANGALVTLVERGSPANKAGLHAGDVVYRYDRQPVESADAFRNYVLGCAPDSVISLAFLRGSQQRIVTVRLSKAPLGGVTQIERRSAESISFGSNRSDYEELLNRIRILEERLRTLEDNR